MKGYHHKHIVNQSSTHKQRTAKCKYTSRSTATIIPMHEITWDQIQYEASGCHRRVLGPRGVESAWQVGGGGGL